MKIWIFNHYSVGKYRNCTGRHHSFAKYLERLDNEVVIFSSNTIRGKAKNIKIENGLSIDKISDDGIHYTFIKSTEYKGNGRDRIKNMFSFYFNIKRVGKKRIENGDKPDVILASSVHPLTLVAGIQLGKKYGIPCICEVRDLWPLALVVFNQIKETGIVPSLLYKGEHWIYKKADALIFTFNGGKDYIKDKGWDKDVNINKIHYINNGIDLEGYEEKKNSDFYDDELENDKFKVVYTGTMGPPNQINMIIDAAVEISNMGLKDIQFLLYGDGISREEQEKRCRLNQISNVSFKGFVDPKRIPAILQRADVTIITEKTTVMNNYGTSENKVFDYLAAGKPIICNDECIRSIVGDSKCAVIDSNIAKAIVSVYKMSLDDYMQCCNSALRLTKEYNYEYLTERLLEILNTSKSGD